MLTDRQPLEHSFSSNDFVKKDKRKIHIKRRQTETQSKVKTLEKNLNKDLNYRNEMFIKVKQDLLACDDINKLAKLSLSNSVRQLPIKKKKKRLNESAAFSKKSSIALNIEPSHLR